MVLLLYCFMELKVAWVMEKSYKGHLVIIAYTWNVLFTIPVLLPQFEVIPFTQMLREDLEKMRKYPIRSFERYKMMLRIVSKKVPTYDVRAYFEILAPPPKSPNLACLSRAFHWSSEYRHFCILDRSHRLTCSPSGTAMLLVLCAAACWYNLEQSYTTSS